MCVCVCVCVYAWHRIGTITRKFEFPCWVVQGSCTIFFYVIPCKGSQHQSSRISYNIAELKKCYVQEGKHMVSCTNVMIWAHGIGTTWIPWARKKVLE
jgi:hypothetical protein